ncbi:MAG: hypothetical protein V2I67_15640 [Thermoanaerobaculales bacterium]|jgi:hypothetical protein|nr:hypothetical protein [Thermoanaerobaculales bacterium]
MKTRQARTAAIMLVALLAMSPVLVEAQSGEDAADLRQFGDYSAQGKPILVGGRGWEVTENLGFPDGERLDAPTSVRAWRDRDDDSLAFCFTLDGSEPDPYTTVFEKTFAPESTTEYVWVTLIGQVTVPSGTDSAARGMSFTCEVEQTIGGETVKEYCPGAGDDFPPYFGRRDNNKVGQQQYGAYQGIVTGIDPNYDVTVRIQMSTNAGTTHACFMNLFVEY